MSMLKKNLIFVGAVLLVVAALALLAETRRHRYVPRDENHPRPLALAACRDCHAPGKVAPQPPDHPPKEQCMLCHRERKG